MSRSDVNHRRHATPRGVTYVVSLHWPFFSADTDSNEPPTEAAALSPSASSCPFAPPPPAPGSNDASANASDSAPSDTDSEELEFIRRDARQLRRRQGNMNQAMHDLRAEHDLRVQRYRPAFIRAFQMIGTLQQEVRDLRSRLDTIPPVETLPDERPQ